jgi:hypothetical protein
MTARNLESRLVKLEAVRQRPDEILLVWRRPDGDAAEAVEGVRFSSGDRVVCAEWFEDSPLPAPRWYRNDLRLEMPADEYEQLNRTIVRVAEQSRPERSDLGLKPFPNVTAARMAEMTDSELIHAVLGVQT